MEIIAYPSGLTEERLYTCSGTSRGWLFQKIAQNLLMDHSVEKLMEPMKRHAAEAPRARRRDEPPSTQLQLGDSRAGWQKAPISSRPEWALNTMKNVHHNPDDGQQDGNAARRSWTPSLRFCSQRINVSLVSGQFCWTLSTLLFRFRKFGHVL